MNKSHGDLCILALLAITLLVTTESLAGPQSTSLGSDISRPLTLVKLKCGLTVDGRLTCENTKTHDHDKSKSGEHSNSGGSKMHNGNKCEGRNECPAGYRDLEKANKYGACCQLIKDTPENNDAPNKDEPKQGNAEPPKSGGCHQVANMQEMSCGGAISCGAIENGKMTCCCVK